MSAEVPAFRRGFAKWRRSMAAQISLSIALVSIASISALGYVLDGALVHKLGEENELLMLLNLAFIRDDLTAEKFDIARVVPRFVDRTERRVRHLHAVVLDEKGGVLAASPRFPVPRAELPAKPLAAEDLPIELTMMRVQELRRRHGELTTVWLDPGQRPIRVLFARIGLPASAAAPAGAIFVALALDPEETLELLAQDRRNRLLGLSVVALIAVLLGVLIARRIVVGAQRLGAASSRISARALNERLPLDGTPTELVELTVAFNRMLHRLQGAFERLSAFSSDLAHDLRTPIGNLLGEAQVALSRPRTADEYRAVLESAVEEYERLSRMIANMLFLARADNDQVGLSAGWVEVRPAFDRVVSYFEQIAEDRGVVLRAGGSIDGRLWADETMLVRALGNLVSNALRYAPPGTEIGLSFAFDESRGCVIEVSNAGPSIAPQHQEKIFERFFRVEAAREGSATDSGLGLAIVRSIMELHGGSASVRSESGERTVFRLAFPPPPRAEGEARTAGPTSA